MEGGVWRQWTDLWRVGYGGNGLTYGGNLSLDEIPTSKLGKYMYRSGDGTRCRYN